MRPLHVSVRQTAAAAGLVLGIMLTAWHGPAAQEPAQKGPPRPDANAAAGRGSGPKNVIEGTDEDDRLAGGDADDWIFGKKGQDVILGGKGRDVIDAADGDDTVDAGPDNDLIDGGAGSDTLRGGDGDDTIEGNDNDDVVDGGAGNDNADGGDDNDVLRGGAGDDVLAGGDGDDSLSGGAGNDSLSGNDGNDSIAGGAGNDRIAGGDGDDSVAGEAGDDVIDGGQGDDSLKGGAGNDIITGSSGADTIDGGNEQDTLSGGDGRDVVNGGSGADFIVGGAGADVVNGGEGDDLILIRGGDLPKAETELLDGGGGEDLLTLNGFTLREAATGQLTDPLTGGTYRLFNIERIQHTHVLPHIGLDPARSTSLLLVNPSSTEAATGRLIFFGADGAPVTPRADAIKNSAFSVPPLGVISIDAFAPQAAAAASAQVFVNVPLGVTAQTASAALGTFAASEGALVDGAVVPINDDAAGGTGVHITNSLLRSRIKLTVHSAAGGELECCSTVVDLPPYAQRTVWVRELFPRLGDFQGLLTVDVGADRPQEGGPVAIVALQRRGTVVAQSPAVRMSSNVATGPLVLSSITSGGDGASVIVLFNPAMVGRARGTVSFFDQQGRPWPVAVNRQAAAATAPFDLNPRGSIVFTMAAGGPIQVGLARIETTEGNVGGIARTASQGSLVDATPAIAATAFVAAVVRDRASGATSELSLTSHGSAATVQVVLHDQAGTAVVGGAAQLRVPANGQVVRTFDDLFPNVKLAALQGTIVGTSDQRVAATATRSGAGARANLPVMPTR